MAQGSNATPLFASRAQSALSPKTSSSLTRPSNASRKNSARLKWLRHRCDRPWEEMREFRGVSKTSPFQLQTPQRIGTSGPGGGNSASLDISGATDQPLLEEEQTQFEPLVGGEPHIGSSNPRRGEMASPRAPTEACSPPPLLTFVQVPPPLFSLFPSLPAPRRRSSRSPPLGGSSTLGFLASRSEPRGIKTSVAKAHNRLWPTSAQFRAWFGHLWADVDHSLPNAADAATSSDYARPSSADFGRFRRKSGRIRPRAGWHWLRLDSVGANLRRCRPSLDLIDRC